MGTSTILDGALIVSLVALWVSILITSRRLARASPETPVRPRRPVKGLTLIGMALWFTAASVEDTGTRTLAFYLGWAFVLIDSGWYLWALKRLERPTPTQH